MGKGLNKAKNKKEKSKIVKKMGKDISKEKARKEGDGKKKASGSISSKKQNMLNKLKIDKKQKYLKELNDAKNKKEKSKLYQKIKKNIEEVADKATKKGNGKTKNKSYGKKESNGKKKGNGKKKASGSISAKEQELLNKIKLGKKKKYLKGLNKAKNKKEKSKLY